MTQQIIRIDGIKWWIVTSTGGLRTPTPLCPDHDLRMQPVLPDVRTSIGWIKGYAKDSRELVCAEGPHKISLPRKYGEEQIYVIDRIDSKVFKAMQVVDLDGELTPIAKEKLKSPDDNYFVTAQLMQSKRGLQLVVYAGKKGSNKKTQIFIEPEVGRVAFDQRDLKPTDVFVEVKATFADGTSHEIKKAKI